MSYTETQIKSEGYTYAYVDNLAHSDDQWGIH